MPVKTDQPPLPAEGGSYLYDPAKKAWVLVERTEQTGFVSAKARPKAPDQPANNEKE